MESVMMLSAKDADSFVMAIMAFSTFTISAATAANVPASARDDASRLPMAFMEDFMPSGSWIPSFEVRPFTTSPRLPISLPESAIFCLFSSNWLLRLFSSASALLRLVCHCMVRLSASPYFSADCCRAARRYSIFSVCVEILRSSTSFFAFSASTLSAFCA